MINEISVTERNYYQNEYEQCKSNTNEKCKFINKMLNRQSSTDSIPQCLENGNEKVTSPQEIADTFEFFFTNLGEGLAKSLLNTLFGSLNHFGQNIEREKKRRRKLYK